MFAAYPPRTGAETAEGASLGQALRQLVQRTGGREEVEHRVESRLLQVLNARRETLDTHLRGIASLLHSEGIALDPARLAHDLTFWNSPHRRVQRRWAREFWRAEPTRDETEEPA